MYGEKSVNIDIESINFRYDTRLSSSVIPTGDDVFKYGGYFKISNEIEILGHQFKISDGQISFIYSKNGSESTQSLSNPYNYTDADGNIWYLYKIESIGKYEIYLKYNNNTIAIYSAQIDDNQNVEFYVSCERLGYKSGYEGSGIGKIQDDKWLNDPSIFSGNSVDNWLFRHTYYRQYDNDGNGYNSYVYTNSKDTEIAVFCQSESGGLTTSAYVSNDTFYKDDYDSYIGTSIDESWSFIPTMYWNTRTITGRNPFDCMAYTSDGRAAASASSIVITGLSTQGKNLQIAYNGSGNGFKKDHGCIVVFENGTIVFPIIKDNNVMIARNTNNPYEGVPVENLTKILKLSTVYPTLRVPVIYKPFYAEVSAVTWNLTGLTLEQNEENVTTVKKVELPLSYKVEGAVHNGLTFGDKFYSGDTSTDYATYLIFKDDNKFFDELSVDTKNDYKQDRTFIFGKGSESLGFYREISGYQSSDKTVSEISYGITEGFPNLENIDPQIKTGRYDNGFDLQTLTDSCSIETSFHQKLKIMATTDDGIDSKGKTCFLFADTIPDTTSIYWIDKADRDIFVDLGVYKVGSNDKVYAYGYYNKKAEYDTKGAAVQVLVDGTKYTFSLTNSKGTKVNKSFLGEDQVKRKGVTLLHKYSLENECVKDINKIISLIKTENKLGVGFRIQDQIHEGTLFNPQNVSAFISVYTRADNTTKKKMVVYKLYPIGSLDVMYPGEAGGMAEGITVSTPPEEGITYEEQTIQIGVTANTEFNVSVSPEGTAWVTINEESGGPDTQSISVTVQENNTDDSRECDIVFKLSGDGESTPRKYHIKQNPNSESEE